MNDTYKLVPVLGANKKPIRNLFTRNGVYYLQAQIHGKRYLRAIPWQTKSQAAKWVREFIITAKAGRADLLEASKARSSYATIGALIDTYLMGAQEQYAIHGHPQPMTAKHNAHRLRYILRHAGYSQVDRLSTQVLTRELAERHIAEAVRQAGNDFQMQTRARVSACSSVNQAKSIFTKWAVSYYANRINLPPTVETFRQAGRGAKRPKYVIPPQALREKTMAAAVELKNADQVDLFAVFLLCHDLGMRSGEAVAAQWSWFESCEVDGRLCREIVIKRRADWKGPKNQVEHRVPIHDTTWADLTLCREQFAQTSDYQQAGFVLPGSTKNLRTELIERRFSCWMRTLGWDRRTYPKAAHELRKLAGSKWYTEAGLEWAAAWLGDNPQTVYHYYADTMQQHAPIRMR